MHTLILDKDTQNAEKLSDYIRKKYNDWVVKVYSNPFALVTAVYDEMKGEVELLVIHISEGSDAVEMARALQEFFPHIRIIFYSESTEYAEEIFRAIPIFFLKLPFKEENISAALERVKISLNEDIGRTITILSKGQKRKIRFSSLHYIESIGRKLLLYTDEGSYETYMTIGEVLSKLPSQFIQCHRSYIVNSDRIMKYGAEGLLLSGGELIPLSRTYQKQTIEKIEHYI